MKITSKLLLSSLTVGALVLSGCASQNNCCQAPTRTTTCTTVSSCDSQQPTPAANTYPVQSNAFKLLAVGYGSPGAYSQYTHAQQKLMAIRAAQVDAYRNLAEQVYGFRVWGNTAVSAFATQNDSVRTYVDAFIRGARVVNTTSIADGNWEVTVELEVSPMFIENLRQSANAAPQIRNNIPGGCNYAGCTSPSAVYVSQ